jgi:Kef-type K+ transport system membrane component KefB
MAELITFLIVIAAGLFFAEFLRPLHLPYVVALIIGGILIGPNGLGLFVPDNTMTVIGEIGLVFLMFMAGLEAKLSVMNGLKMTISKFALLNGLIPFFCGLGIALLFGYGWLSALFLGTIFISSSIAVVIPSLAANDLLRLNLGKTILGATIIEDALSLVVFSVILQVLNPTHNVPLPIFYGILLLFLIFLRMAMLRLRKFYHSLLTRRQKEDVFENELRFIFAILLGTVALFEILGLHAIIAGFFAGLVFSESIKKEMLRRKLHAVSYGLFIPVFFIIIGAEMDIWVLVSSSGVLALSATVIAVSIISKFLSGYLGARMGGFSNNEGLIAGSSTIPQLSTTLAVAFVALETGILDQAIIIAMTSLSVITSLLGPSLLALMVRRLG